MSITPTKRNDILGRLELLYLEVIPTIRKFPKDQKYTMGENIDRTFLKAVNSFFTASYDKTLRERGLIEMRGHLHQLVFLLRVSNKMGFLSKPLYAKYSQELTEIGKIISSWIKK